jgi:translation initiation factor eIF-2B subunit beta
MVGIAGTYKLTPLFSHTQDRALNNLLCPCDAAKYDEDGVCFDNVAVVIPASDYIPPELINLYVTNNGSHQPSYVYRLMSEYYHPKDHILDY